MTSIAAARLGPRPSTLDVHDLGARLQRDADHEVTDFAGLFAADAPFVVRMRPSLPYTLAPVCTVAELGVLRVTSGRLSTLDPLDTAQIDRTVQPLDREVPCGAHPVLLAQRDGAPAALVVLFGDTPVHSWAPARPAAEITPMPTPPRLPMSAVRYALAVADADTARSIVDTVMVGMSREEANALRAIFGGGPLAPDQSPKRTPSGRDARVEALRAELMRAPAAAHEGLVALRVEGATPSYWGLAADGAVSALAVDLGRARIAREAGRSSAAGVCAQHESLVARQRTRGVPAEEAARHATALCESITRAPGAPWSPTAAELEAI